jgi:hypothetical protein
VPLYTAPQAAGLPTTSYLTVAEYKAAPTDIDVTSLVPGGSQQQQDDSLAEVIAQASSAMDAYVHYTLGATLDTETRARVRVTRDGYVRVPTRGIPILEIDSFQVGLTPSQMQSIVSGADAWVEDNVIYMPVMAATSLPPRVALFGPGDRVFCQWTYVNGYANTLLTATASPGDTSLHLQSPLGIYPGTSFVIYDSGRSETVQVASGYASSTGAGPVVVPLATALLNQHLTVGISVSALPPNVKKAAVLVTTALIKVRGATGIVLDSIDGKATKEAGLEGGALGDIEMAQSLLKKYILPSYF